jgi:hypothetical protein
MIYVYGLGRSSCSRFAEITGKDSFAWLVAVIFGREGPILLTTDQAIDFGIERFRIEMNPRFSIIGPILRSSGFSLGCYWVHFVLGAKNRPQRCRHCIFLTQNCYKRSGYPKDEHTTIKVSAYVMPIELHQATVAI